MYYLFLFYFSLVKMSEPILVDTKQRDNFLTTTSTNFTYTLANPTKRINYIRLDWFRLDSVIYNVPAGSNIIYYNENSTNKTATVTPGVRT